MTAQPRPPEAAGPDFIAFCNEHRAEISEILRTRTLQTTTADRAVQLLLPFDYVSRAIGAPFSILEVGCSAGLLLLFDHYRYQFADGRSLGNPDAKVVISSFELVGTGVECLTAFPAIRDRVGLDLNPLDVSDADARNWILACSSTDRPETFDALRNALKYRASTPLKVVAGDAMATLPTELAKIEGPVCVFHSRCLYQWPGAAQEAFSDMLKQLGRVRPLHRLGIEWSGERDPSAAQGGGRNEITHTLYRDGESTTQVLGRIKQKSRVEWFGKTHGEVA